MSYSPSPAHSQLAIRLERISLYAIPFTVTGVVFIPIVFLFITALSKGPYKGLETNFTFEKVIKAYSDPTVLSALMNSLTLGLVVSLISTCIAIPMAWLLVRTHVPGRRLYVRLMTLAFYMSPFFLAIAWSAIGAPRSGILSQFSRTFFGITQPVGNIYSYAGIVFVSVLHFVPISYLLISSAFTAAAGELEDASQMSRAGFFTTFRYVTLPIITPTIVSSLLQVGVFASEQFAVPYFLGIQFNFQTLPSQIYLDLSLSEPDFNRAAACGTMLLWFSAAGIYLFRHYMQLGDRYASMAGKSARTPPAFDLRGWRWIASGIIAFYLFLSVIAPVLALFWGSLRRFPVPNLTLEGLTFYNWINLWEKPQIVVATKNTLLVAGVGAMVTVLFCLIISFFIVRTKAFGRSLVDYVIALPVAIPSIVMGLGVLAFYLALPLPFYGTLWGLGIAYAIRFMGYGVRSLNGGLQQIHSELTEAAYMSRASTRRVIWDIQFPLLRPTIANTWVVLFVHFAQEVNLTVLLYTQVTITLPLIIFNQASGSLLNAVYPTTLLLILITFTCIELVRLIPGYNSDVGHAIRRAGTHNKAEPIASSQK